MQKPLVNNEHDRLRRKTRSRSSRDNLLECNDAGRTAAVPTPRTGSIEPHGDHFDIRVRLPDKSKGPRMCLPAGLTREEAKAQAAEHQRIYDQDNAAGAALPVPAKAPPPSAQTFDAWAGVELDGGGWFADRKRRGLSDEAGRWKKWISPRLG